MNSFVSQLGKPILLFFKEFFSISVTNFTFSEKMGEVCFISFPRFLFSFPFEPWGKVTSDLREPQVSRPAGIFMTRLRLLGSPFSAQRGPRAPSLAVAGQLPHPPQLQISQRRKRARPGRLGGLLPLPASVSEVVSSHCTTCDFSGQPRRAGNWPLA